MVNVIKFSQFANVNLNTATNQLVGVSNASGGINFQSPFVNTWTTATRPATPYAGLYGYNSTLNGFEFWNGTTWIQFETGTISFSWNYIISTSQAMASNNGYIVDNVSLVTLSLPTISNLGDEIIIVGRGTGGWKISQSVNQQIIIGSDSSTIGTGGSIASTNRRNSLALICTAVNLEWTAPFGPQGIITIV
jgi:hypothetical protein